MADFKKGDRVRYTGKSEEYSEKESIGKLGTVLNPEYGKETPMVSVRWDEKGLTALNVYRDNLELVKETKAVFKNGDRVVYIGDQKHLADLVGVVKRDTLAPNGNILVLFDGRERPTVVNPKNLGKPGKLSKPINLKALASTGDVKPLNPKDTAVLAFGSARIDRTKANVAYDAAKKRLCDLGIIVGGEDGVIYQSNAAQLSARTAAGRQYVTVDSLTTAMDSLLLLPATRQAILDAAILTQKGATVYDVIA